MIRDGALARYKALVMIHGSVIEREDIERISEWVKSGGMVVACDFGGFTTVEGDATLFSQIFDTSSAKSPAIKEYGAGLSVYVSDGWREDHTPVAAIAGVLDSLSTRAQANLIPDGVSDGVYISDLGGSLLIYNSNENEVERELQVRIGERRKVELPPGISRQ